MDRGQSELHRGVDMARTGELERKQQRIEREHRELGRAQPHRRARAMHRERRAIRRRKVSEREERPVHVVRRAARERREQIARVASDAARAADGLEMSRIEDDPHRRPYSTAQMLSVVVPTYNEAGPRTRVADRLHAALAGREWELVSVDDGSPDGTAHIAAALAPRIPVAGVRPSGTA